jgi:hypothetical protein
MRGGDDGVSYTGKALRSNGRKNLKGEAIVTAIPITWLGFVDAKTGNVVESKHPLAGINLRNKILIFPKSIGSTVGPYVLLNLQSLGNAPLAIINRESDQITVAGCSVAQIPLIYNLNRDPTIVFQSGDHLILELNDGQAIVTKT